MKSSERKVVLRIHFGNPEVPGFDAVKVESITWRVVAMNRDATGVLCANPSTRDLAMLFLWKCLSLWKLRVAVFDLILKRPEGVQGHLAASIKSLLLRGVDLFLMIHRDWRGYQRYYRINPKRCRYVPFKANNFDLASAIASKDGDYVVSCGASQRDFDTLLKAVADTGHRTVILLSDEAARAHRAVLDRSLLRNNVEVVRNVLGREDYNSAIANSRLVVIPILSETIQPAGISVLLEAMALGKPVIVSRGSSTHGVVDDTIASLIEPGNPQELRQAIKSLWDDAQRRAEMSRKGREFALNLSDSDRLANEVCGHFHELCAK